MPLNATIDRVTDRIRDRSHATRSAYMAQMRRAGDDGPVRAHLSCGNQAHAYAAMGDAKDTLAEGRAPNLGIVTAYNDMLSAHQPFEDYPKLIRDAARDAGGTAQVAGGVPAMCDGVTQGQPGMELSLFSRDVIALAAGVALSHNCFDAAAYLGVCDKIVPGLVMAAATFGHIPAVFVPAGPMTSGLPNDEKSKIRQQFATGEVGRDKQNLAIAGYNNVTESLDLLITGASVSAITTTIRGIESMLDAARQSARTWQGTRVYLEVEHDGDSAAWRSEVLAGQLSYNEALDQLSRLNVEARLTLTRRPFFEGARTALELSTVADTTPSTSERTLHITDNATADERNYIHIAATEIEGNLPAPIELQIRNAEATARQLCAHGARLRESDIYRHRFVGGRRFVHLVGNRYGAANAPLGNNERAAWLLRRSICAYDCACNIGLCCVCACGGGILQ